MYMYVDLNQGYMIPYTLIKPPPPSINLKICQVDQQQRQQ